VDFSSVWIGAHVIAHVSRTIWRSEKYLEIKLKQKDSVETRGMARVIKWGHK